MVKIWEVNCVNYKELMQRLEAEREFIMKKILSLVLAVCICLTLFTISLPASAAEGGGVLSFLPADVVFNGDGSVIYLSDRTSKKVYSIDTQTFEQKSVSFDLMPESMYYKDGKLYVSLCEQTHSSYWWEEDQSGAFAIIDCEAFTKTAQHNIKMDPYDIVVSKGNVIYITSGSGQWTDIYGFDQDGKIVATGQTRQMSTIKYNPVLNRIYSITSDSSPRNMSAFVLEDNNSFEDRGGNMGTSYGWPYHGDYSMGTVFQVSPDGAYIFNSSGNVFTCAADRSKDMRFYISLNKGWTDIAFNEDGTKFYTALNNKQIYAYNYDGFEGTATYETKGYPQYIFVKDNTLISVSKETLNGSVYFIETIDLAAPQTTIGTTITSKALTYENGRALLSAKTNTKTVFNGDMVYIADGIDNAVYAIDTAALTETKIMFQDTPNSLYYDNGELFIGFGNNGVVAILDAETLEQKDRLVLGTVFYDIAVGKDGFIYIIENFGSSAFSYARSFSRATGQQISSISVYPRNGKFMPHPVNNMFYWADTGVSPQDINALVYEKGEIKNAYDSPYHGDYSIGSIIRISPDGLNIFASSGNVFRSSHALSEDMRYKNSFTAFVDLVFDLQNNQMFASQSRANLIAYDYTTYENKGFIRTVFPIKEMTLNDGDIIALSSENNAFYLELLDSSEVLQIAPERINVTVADTVFLTAGRSLSLNPSVLYNDGTSKAVTNTAEYASSDEDVVTVSSSGGLQAKACGHSEVTIEFDGKTKIINVYVDFDITSISVEGYDIGFSPSKTYYAVMLPVDATEIPNVSYEAPDYVVVSETPAMELPGTTTLVVTDAGGNFTKTYSIFFYVSTPPVQSDENPFFIDGYYEVDDAFVHLNVWIEDNPNYYGAAPEEFSVVIQLMSSVDEEPILISATKNTREIKHVFSSGYYAIVMVVDKFGQKDYMGILLAEPKRT